MVERHLARSEFHVHGGGLVDPVDVLAPGQDVVGSEPIPVSYTHLTLPTLYSV